MFDKQMVPDQLNNQFLLFEPFSPLHLKTIWNQNRLQWFEYWTCPVFKPPTVLLLLLLQSPLYSE